MPAAAPAIAARQAAATAMMSSTNDINKTPSEFVPILVMGILIILTVAGLFGYRAWKGRQMASEIHLTKHEKKLNDWYSGSDEDSIIEKPSRAALGQDSEAFAGWVPQIHTWKGVQVQGMQLPSESVVGKARSGSFDKKKPVDYSLERQISPPPSYPIANAEKPKITLTVPPTPAFVAEDDKPIASPLRTASMLFTASQPESTVTEAMPTTTTTSDDESVLPLPRVVIVKATFTPTMEDELPIVRGEAIRMLAEYKDGWCVVQRVGAFDSPKGVVPRSCLQERQTSRRAI